MSVAKYALWMHGQTARGMAIRVAMLGSTALVSAQLVATHSASAQTLITGATTLSGTIDGNNAPGYFVNGTLTVNNGTLQNFTTTGGSGSGGGGGFGGAVFVNNGGTAILNSVDFSHNTAVGGVGGTTSGTGGVLNNGIVNGYFSANSNGATGAAGSSGSTDPTFFGDGEGNGVTGSPGAAGGNATHGFGGTGGAGAAGTNGFSSNQAAYNAKVAAGLVVAADTAATIADATLAAGSADPFTVTLTAGYIAQGLADAATLSADGLALDAAVIVNNSFVNGFANGSIGSGGNGANGGTGGAGSTGFGGGRGGAGGAYGVATLNNGQTDGTGGNGGTGGTGGFGGGGGAGGTGFAAHTASGTSGVTGVGGAAGFGGGVGSTGGLTNGTPGIGGGGGAGYGGSIFVDSSGHLILTGTSQFDTDNAVGGTSLNGGIAGTGAGTDLFMMTGAVVQIAPGAGQTITFNGSIADNSISSIGASNAPGNGASLTTYAGLTVFNGQNTYSGQTIINGGALGGGVNTAANTTGTPNFATTGGALQAADSQGLPTNSNLTFTGASQFTGGVLQTNGLFDRQLGANSNRVQWTGSGGFAAIDGPLTVTLNNYGTLVWGSGSFVPFGSSLIFGSANSTDRVTFTNGFTVSGGTASVLVVNNGTAASDAALAGVVSGTGNLSVGGGGYNGTLNLLAANTYTGLTNIAAGATVVLGAGGGIGGTANAIVDGTLDISATTAGATVGALYGNGAIALGTQTLTFGNASNPIGNGVFGGVISGTGGVTLAAGNSQTFSTDNAYSGQTTIGANAVLYANTINSLGTSGVADNGSLDISGATTGVVATSLSGNGVVSLGANMLGLTAAGTTFTGVLADGGTAGGTLGGLAVLAGTQTLTGTNTYTGATVIMPNATLALGGTGSVAPSIAVMDGGTFDISATTAGATIQTLADATTPGSAPASVVLGNQTLTIANASTSYSGGISGTGNLHIAGGTQGLSGTSTYTGTTTIDPTVTLALIGSGGIAGSAQVIDNGSLDISTTTAGAAIQTLAGNGTVLLGAQPLTVTAGSSSFDGSITGTGAVTVAGGTQSLSGANVYTGLTTTGSGGALALVGAGSIAASAGLVDNGVFDISATAAGATVNTLSGNGAVVLGTQTLNLAAAADTFAGVISGAGGVHLAAGTEALAGANSFSGATTVDPGATLILTGGGGVGASSVLMDNGTVDISTTTAGASVQSLAGNGAVLLGTQALSFTNASTSFDGVISGAGGLMAAGGTQTLTGINTYTGATVINAGAVLALAGNGSIAASSGVANAGTFDISATAAGATIASLTGTGDVELGAQTLTVGNAAGTYSGSINGSGGVAITGGTQTLTGVSTYTGGTTVQNATLIAGSSAALGAATSVLNLVNATLRTVGNVAIVQPITLTGTNSVNTNAATVALSGPVGGSGALIAAGGGTLNLSGTNTYSGGTQVIEHTRLTVASDSALGAATAPVVVESGVLQTTASFATDRPITVMADGMLDTGSNELSFTAPLTYMTASGDSAVLFTGSAHLQGAFSLQGDVLTIKPDGVLEGVGTVSSNTVVQGTLWPGNSPGTLTFTAPVGLTSGAAFNLNIDGTGTGTGAGNYSRVVVTGAGNSFTAGGTLVPILRGITGSATNSYTPPVTTSFTVVQASGGVAGSFVTLSQPAVGLPAGTRFDALYTSNAINLVVTPASYRKLGAFATTLTENQTAVGTALDAFRGVAGPRNDPAATAALGVLYQQQPQTLPVVFNTLAATIYGDTLMQGLERSRMFGGAVSDRAAAAITGRASPAVSTVNIGGGFTTWMAGGAGTTHVGADGNTGYHASMGGFTLGADKALGHFVAGVAVGSSFGTVTSSATDASANLTTTNVAGYGTWSYGRLYVDGQVGFNVAEATVRRMQPVFGTEARSSPTGAGVNFAIDAGVPYDVRGWQLTPIVGLRVDQASRGHVTESGAGGLSLSVDGQTATSARTRLGGQAGTSFPLGRGYVLTPTARLFWSHEFADQDVETNQAFTAGMQDIPVQVRTAKLGRDGVGGGITASLRTPMGAVIYVDYGADLRTNSNSQAITAGLMLRW